MPSVKNIQRAKITEKKRFSKKERSADRKMGSALMGGTWSRFFKDFSQQFVNIVTNDVVLLVAIWPESLFHLIPKQLKTYI